MTRRQAKPKALKPTGPVYYQESREQVGQKYVYQASNCSVLCGWPARPSFKGLKAFVKELGSVVLVTTRERGSMLVYFEGPLAEVERIKAWTHEWTKAYREAHSEQ
jgi:hypothetical protein